MFQGLKYQEAADTLGIPLGSVKSRMHEAVVRLRRTLWRRHELIPGTIRDRAAAPHKELVDEY